MALTKRESKEINQAAFASWKAQGMPIRHEIEETAQFRLIADDNEADARTLDRDTAYAMFVTLPSAVGTGSYVGRNLWLERIA